MVDRIVRQESWINEVLRIKSFTGRINEVEFGYSQLYAIPSLVLKSVMPILM